MSVDAYYFIIYLQTFLSAVVALFSFFVSKGHNNVTKLIGVLFSISFLCNSFALTLGHLHKTEFINLPASIYDITFVLIAAAIFNEAFDQKYKFNLLIITLVFVVVAVVNLLFFQKLSITSYTKFAGSFTIIVLCLFYFYKLLIELPTVYLHRLPMFWVSSAFLIYSSGAIFLYAFTDYLIKVLKDDYVLYGSFHNLLFIFQDLLILIGLRYELAKFRNESKIR